MAQHGGNSNNKNKKYNPSQSATQTCPKGHVFQRGAIPAGIHRAKSPQCYK